MNKTEIPHSEATGGTSSPHRPSSSRRAWSTEPGMIPRFDKFGRRIMISSAGSAANSTPGTPRRGDSDVSTDKTQ